ncbi:PREDICTED: baculoviral IAP repeat-containing protein 6-like, partial [Priapulus caudatus]|uniref:Baculoviral IAP repeat-containing protein 6-like n=1 Tax=Priapulus caudatus TaxID=37621 RepID=A0ABM1F533_PRICU
MLLQLLLEDEKILVHFRSDVPLHQVASPITCTMLKHPMFRCGRNYRVLYLSLQTTVSGMIAKILDKPSVSLSAGGATAGKDDDKKDGGGGGGGGGEATLKLLDHVSLVAGISAQEKRAKAAAAAAAAAAGLPPRPPSRRGHAAAATLAACPERDVACLTHALLPGRSLPAELSLAQVVAALQERGLAAGHPIIELTLSVRKRKTRAGGGGGGASDAARERFTCDAGLPSSSSPSSSSAAAVGVGEGASVAERATATAADVRPQPTGLQVFASVGGLALLAEHLPLLYPEVTQAATMSVAPPERAPDLGIGTDWVKVESEEYYE